MSNRKRRTAQPLLEPMESRVVPSALGIQSHQVRAVASHVEHINKAAKTPKETQHTINEGMRRLQQQLAQIHARSLERTPSARETPAEKVTTETSSLLKSVFASL
jgi:hypothetical protein